MKASLVVNLLKTDSYTKDLTVLWDSSGFFPCKPTDYKIVKVVELASLRKVMSSEYKKVFEVTSTGFLKVTGFLALISNW